jgi:thiamine pyrophosphokinase
MNTFVTIPHRFDAVVCLNGTIPSDEVFEHIMERPLIAADGAATQLFERGIIPEFIVGDLDSIRPDVRETLMTMSEFVHQPDQETNDFEKALAFAESMLWKNLLVVGIHGGDLEHTLNNWSVLMRYGRTMHIAVIDQQRIAIPMFESFAYEGTEQEIISLIPQPTARITTRGLHWALNDEHLALGSREGARNRATHPRIEVELHDGAILFFCDAALPNAPHVREAASAADND